MTLHIVILAAGKGTRMRSNLPKVLHTLGGYPIIEHVLKAAQKLKPTKIHVVYGEGGDLVQKALAKYDVNWVCQEKQLGTGHAVMQVLPFIEHASRVLVLCGDVPLITAETLEQLVTDMPDDGLSLVTAKFRDPTNFGRIVRDSLGVVQAIVEHKDASPSQLQINEINSGILVTTSKVLRDYLPRLQKHNAQSEYYLTDLVALLVSDNLPVNSLLVTHEEEVAGINTKKQLADLERNYQMNIANNLMQQGVTLFDPARFDVRGDLTVATDVTIDVNTVFVGEVFLGENVYIEPNNFLKNVRVGKNSIIKANCVIEDAIIDDDCVVGPFARIRPGTHLESGAKIGNFVETKNTKIGKKSKANHLSYLGDTIVGDNANIGAGTITCNYDGASKYKTIIEDGAFVGSNTALVAPVVIGKNAVIGAGSVVTADAPANKLTLARAKQVTVENWQRKEKK